MHHAARRPGGGLLLDIRRPYVRERGSTWTCRECGTVIDIEGGRVPDVRIHGASGQPNMRVLVLDGEELHRCEIAARSD
jgi:hypothetical protein